MTEGCGNVLHRGLAQSELCFITIPIKAVKEWIEVWEDGRNENREISVETDEEIRERTAKGLHKSNCNVHDEVKSR